MPAQGQEEAPPPDLVVIDLREEDKAGERLVELDGKCNKHVYRIPETALTRLKVDILKDDLTEILSHEGEAKTLTVLEWSIYYNKQVQTSGGVLSGVGIQGYSVPGQKKERKAGSICPREQSAGGWYEAGELESVYFPLISEFQGTYGGKPLKVRVVHSPRAKIEGKFQGDAGDTRELIETVKETAVAVAEAIFQ